MARPRVLIIGQYRDEHASLLEGTSTDWLLALADGRGFDTDGRADARRLPCRDDGHSALRQGCSRAGRVATVRGTAVPGAIGVLVVILVPASVGQRARGRALGHRAARSGSRSASRAAADDPKRAVKSVATVSSIAYMAFMLGPMLIGLLGERFGLILAFWPLVAFAGFAAVFALRVREPGATRSRRFSGH